MNLQEFHGIHTFYAAITSIDPSSANFTARISCTIPPAQRKTPCAMCPMIRGSSSYIARSDTDHSVAISLEIVVSQSRHEEPLGVGNLILHGLDCWYCQFHGPVLCTSCLVQISTYYATTSALDEVTLLLCGVLRTSQIVRDAKTTGTARVAAMAHGSSGQHMP